MTTTASTYTILIGGTLMLVLALPVPALAANQDGTNKAAHKPEQPATHVKDLSDPASSNEKSAKPGQSTAPPKVQKTMDKLLEAIVADDYQAFTTPGNATFKQANPKGTFEKFSKAVGPILKKGYKTHYFGQLTKQQNAIYLWKLTFDKAPDDALIGISYNEAHKLINITFR